VREALWEHAGLLRSEDGLTRLLDSPSLLARLVAESALARRESRGGHFRVDFPFEDPALARHVVLRSTDAPVLVELPASLVDAASGRSSGSAGRPCARVARASSEPELRTWR
jgi:succinate dehydrogenase/fumarate reductase flavoprotein subunit